MLTDTVNSLFGTNFTPTVLFVVTFVILTILRAIKKIAIRTLFICLGIAGVLWLVAQFGALDKLLTLLPAGLTW